MSLIVAFQHFCVCEIFDQEPVFNKKPVTRCTLGPTVQETGGPYQTFQHFWISASYQEPIFIKVPLTNCTYCFGEQANFIGIFYHTFQYHQILYCQHVIKDFLPIYRFFKQ